MYRKNQGERAECGDIRRKPHIENGRYGSAGHRGEPSPFGSIPNLENGLARKFDRDFCPGSGCPVTNTGFSNSPGLAAWATISLSGAV